MNEADEFLDLPSCFRPVAATHGRELFELVLQTGLASQACAMLAQGLNEQGVQVLTNIANSFNIITNAYVEKQGWAEEQLAACDTAIKLAFKGQIIIPETSIIIEH